MEKTQFPKQHQDQQPGKESEMTPRPEYIRQNYHGSGKLDAKVALITGGDSGIGRSIAVHFAREGAKVAIVYFIDNEDSDAHETKKLVEKEGSQCLLLKGDLKDADFCASIVRDTVKSFGKLNIVVNNAAMQFPKEDFTDISDEQLQVTFETNIYPYFRVSREALPHLKKGDTIINTASVTAYEGSPQLVDYSSTKGAIVSFTRALAAQIASKEIRVNGVAPGPIWTPLIPASFDAEKVAKFGSDTPMRRAGQPSEIGPAYVYLACEDSSYMTGQVLHLNGGQPVGG
ncbi:SDR family oxidoreductase [Flavobacterium sp. MAH-1]|uniref:SDR family oxidoreductase n=1 Tax=Flavobacterium agri TaxID=2743471 RepID=A0A7Y8Y0P7_9FLAO|nr:SDR family oxidoreductase [Flavobacterium agri]NUY80424.1 SDR family oxidoreductase [Flavobacterium agri]NYA70449.1 SDR family oxidoreductase [Flavobacterium agri]